MGSNKYPLIAPPGGGAPHLPGPGQPAPLAPGEFRSVVGANLTSFAFTKIDPPSSLYVQREDVLFLEAATAPNVAEVVTFNFRFLRVPEQQGGQPSDAVQPGTAPPTLLDVGLVETGADVLNIASGPGASNRIRTLGEGYLLGLTAVSANATTRGQTFARAILLRGGQTKPFSAQILLGDYITVVAPAGWPGGRVLNTTEGPGWLRSNLVTAPVAGADFAFVVPAGTRQRVQSFTAQFAASAAAGNRNIEVIVDDGASIFWRTSVPAVVTTGQTVQVSGTGSNQPTGIVTTDFTVLIPPGLVLPAGWRVRTLTAGILAGDQWSNIVFGVEEWLDGF